MKFTTRKVLTVLLICCFVVLALAGCGGKQAGSEPIRIGAKSMTEQMILQEILAQLIEAKTDLMVERVEPIAGGTSNLQIAMENGEIDLYPEYTGTGWLTVLKQEETKDADYMFEQLNKQYNENYDMSWVGLYGFENTYTLAVRAETAAQYNLQKISDLSAVSDQLVFGANFSVYYFIIKKRFDAVKKNTELRRNAIEELEKYTESASRTANRDVDILETEFVKKINDVKNKNDVVNREINKITKDIEDLHYKISKYGK